MAAVVALLAAMVMTGCGGDSSFVPPIGATPLPVTELLQGVLAKNGAMTYPFVALAGGPVTVTLTSIEPAVVVGLSLGTWNGASCQIVIADDYVEVGEIVVGTASTIGNLCARIYDVGQITDLVTYQITLVHP